MAFKWLVLAGSITGAYGYADAPAALDARFNGPIDCALSPDRSLLYVSDYGNHCIRRITLSGTFPVDTLVSFPAALTSVIHVAPATGNVWASLHEGGLNKVTRITPAGAMTTVFTYSGNYITDALPDTAEAYVRIKFAGDFTCLWQLVRVADGANLGVVGTDGAFSDHSGQMWSVRHPDVWVYSRDYAPPSSTGASLLRTAPYGADASAGINFSPDESIRTFKIVPGPDELYPPHECYLGVHSDGRVVAEPFDADPAALWMSAHPERIDALGLPPIPSRTLERDVVSGVLYFPTSMGWGSSGASGATDQGVPANAIVLAVPADDLSLSYQ
jgi:hypothetical protein